MKKILITGKNSYIGVSVENWLKRNPDEYKIDTLEMKYDDWRNYDFSSYDVVFHVAGIAHADVSKVDDATKKLYYDVNTKLAIETAKKAKDSGVKQFIFMSSMIIYSGCKEKNITFDTIPNALNFYGDSKLQADNGIRELETTKFKVVILRPPMIYGPNSKGNYPKLAKLAKKLLLFPKVNNQRSMLYIDNLCEFIKLCIDNEEHGIFFPQNKEYTNTSKIVKMIANTTGKKLGIVPGFNWIIKLFMKIPGMIGNIFTKVFGDSTYDLSMSKYKQEYRVCSLEESIKATER